jgi:CBS domain-containing protein
VKSRSRTPPETGSISFHDPSWRFRSAVLVGYDAAGSSASRSLAAISREDRIAKADKTGRQNARWAIGRFLPVVLGGLIAIAVLPVVLVGFLGTQDVSRRLLRDRGDLLAEAVVTPIEDLLTPVARQVEEAANLIARGEVDPDNDAQFATFVQGPYGAYAPGYFDCLHGS